MSDDRSFATVLFFIGLALVILKVVVVLAIIAMIAGLSILAFGFFFSRWPKQTLICTALLIAAGISGYAMHQLYLTVRGNHAEVRIYLNEEDYTYTYYNNFYDELCENTIEAETIIAIYEKYNKTYKRWDTHIEGSVDHEGRYSHLRNVSIEKFLNEMSLSEYYVSMTYKEYEENYDADLAVWLKSETELVSKLEAEAESSEAENPDAETGTAVDIPSDAASFDGHHYYVYESEMTWDEAETFCENMGGHLVTITSAKEQAFVASLLEEHGDTDYMIGLSYAFSDYGVWVTGEEVVYTNWGEGEPDHLDDQKICIMANGIRSGSGYYIAAGQWDDLDDRGCPFICEWEE